MSDVDVDRPSPGVLRAMSDETVLRALAGAGRLTRAQLAETTGLSKPTATESVRRLVDKGLIRDTGERTTGRGGVGTYYAVADAANVAVAVVIAPDGVVVVAVDAAGNGLAHVEHGLERPTNPGAVRRELRAAVRAALRGRPSPRAALAVVSAADPVDRTTGRLVQLPDAPFLVGDLDPAAALRVYVDGPISVDNDVNWAARHEQAARVRAGRSSDDFGYLFLGEGLGCALVADGAVRRGGSGLAGEISHVLVRGPHGAATAFTDVFARLGVRRPGSAAIDVDALTLALARSRPRAIVARAVGDVIAALVALGDPADVVLAGSWGTQPSLVAAVVAVVAADARPVPVTATTEPTTGAVAGVRAAAVHALTERLVAASRDGIPASAVRPDGGRG